jgi:hypothetical protein
MQERVMDGELPEGLNDMLYTRRNISVVRNKITEILADQYEASLTQSGVGKAMTSDAIYSTIRLDVPVDRATVGVALVGMVEEGIVAKVGEGYSWL